MSIAWAIPDFLQTKRVETARMCDSFLHPALGPVPLQGFLFERLAQVRLRLSSPEGGLLRRRVVLVDDLAEETVDELRQLFGTEPGAFHQRGDEIPHSVWPRVDTLPRESPLQHHNGNLAPTLLVHVWTSCRCARQTVIDTSQKTQRRKNLFRPLCVFRDNFKKNYFLPIY